MLCASPGAYYVGVSPDGGGGAFVVWADSRAGNLDIYVQRVTDGGWIAGGWAGNGVPACAHPADQTRSSWSVVPDGLGGVLIVWTDFRNAFPSGTTGPDVYAQRLLADGSVAPGWPADGAPVCRAPGYQSEAVILADGGGGAFVSWTDYETRDIHLQHLTGIGEVASGWPVDGLPVCTDPSDQQFSQLAADGVGGVFVAWADSREGAPQTLATYGVRITGDGQIASGWPANGAPLASGRTIRELISDGQGGAFLACATAGSLDLGYFVMHFDGSGAPASGWPATGAPVCSAVDERAGLRMVADGAGGVLLAWYDYRDIVDDEIFALRLGPDGSRPAGWPADGLRVTSNAVSDNDPTLASDGSGGVYLCWDRGSDDRVVCQHLTPEGAVGPGWPLEGLPMSSDSSTHDARLVPDGNGGAIGAFEHEGGTIRAVRLAPSGLVPVLVSLVSVDAEAERVRLTWYVAGVTSFTAIVERRAEAGEWEALGTVLADGTGALIYEDRTVAPGARYGYRLSYRDDAGAAHGVETWVSVPAPRFAFHGLAPNPSPGPPVASFTLPSAEPATLDLFDLGGRLVESREVGSLGRGAHSVRLGERARLAVGVYAVRLRQGARIEVRRAVVVR